MTIFRNNFLFSRPKVLMIFVLVIDQVFLIFSFFFQILRIFTLLNVVNDPFFTRKTIISEKNSLTTPFLLSSYFRAHPTTLLLKIFGGDGCMGRPPPQIF